MFFFYKLSPHLFLDRLSFRL